MLKKTKRTLEVMMVLCLLSMVTMGVKDCQKEDVITGMKIAGNTMDILYNGTVKVLVAEYCKGLPEGHKDVDICQEWTTVIDPAMTEFLGTTYPSVIRIAEVVIPDGQEPLDENAQFAISEAYVKMFKSLPKEQQARIYEKLAYALDE